MLKGIMSISGQPGLYKMVAEAKNRIIVESLTTGKRIPVSTTAKISSLEEIAIYTQSGDISLKEVLKSISENESGNLLPDPKGSNQDIRSFFEKVLPEYDQERVYVSDIRKILIWYNILQENNLLDFSEIEPEKVESPAPAEGEAKSE